MTLLSVTQVLKCFSDFSRAPADRLKIAADRGTRAHEICARIARGEWVPRVPEDCRGYVESFRWYFEEFVEDVLLTETKLVDESLRFYGHPDLIVTNRGPTNVLVDIKTPVTKHRLWGAQLAAYKHLAITNGFSIDRIGSLRLNPDGKPPIFDEYLDDHRDLNAFMSALNAVRYFKGE